MPCATDEGCHDTVDVWHVRNAGGQAGGAGEEDRELPRHIQHAKVHAHGGGKGSGEGRVAGLMAHHGQLKPALGFASKMAWDGAPDADLLQCAQLLRASLDIHDRCVILPRARARPPGRVLAPVP